MPDGLNTYKSTLTGPELDEALRNIGNVQANIEKAAGYAETAEQYGTIVEQNQTAIQAIEDNLPAVQGAAANAQSAEANAQAAAQSAQEAQTAAQQALGFRTFFSAVSPDENGDLDPSRPMNTPTAQASWTIKSKGDRIQSVQVNGFTQQAGTGDPSPDNVREISTAGMRMVAVTFDGSSDENWSLPSTGGANTQFISLQENYNVSTNTVVLAYCDRLKKVLPTFPGDDPTENNTFTAFCSPLGTLIFKVNLGASSIANLRAILSSNPLTIWYVPADESQATGLYVPIQSQGHEYRCQMLELTAPLCDGDTLKTRVKSGCDVRTVFDGSSDENWTLSSGSITGFIRAIYFLGDSLVNNFALSDRFRAGNATEWSNPSSINGDFVTTSNGSLCVQVKTDLPNTVDSFKSILRESPLTLLYKTTSYTEANDIPVALETHTRMVRILDGTESFSLASDVSNVFQLYTLTNGKNFTVMSNQYKNGGTYWVSMPDFSVLNSRNILGFRDSRFSATEEFKANLSSQYSAGTPVTIVYELATPAVYAHDPVELVAVPYTDSDVTAANQLAATPSTLPYFDSADVPTLLDDTGMSEPNVTVQPDGTLDAENTQKAAEWIQETARRLMAAPLASTLPVAGTYVVSSQDGTTVLVSLKAMQDGGDADTLGGIGPGGFATAAQGQLAQTAMQSIFAAGIGPVVNKELQQIDLLEVNIHDYDGPQNSPLFFGSNNPSTDLTNSPYSAGPFYGYRQTFFSRFPSSNSPHLITVVIFETYPMAGRIWGNTYDATQSNWIGWHGTNMA